MEILDDSCSEPHSTDHAFCPGWLGHRLRGARLAAAGHHTEPAPRPPDEVERLESLRALELLDTEPEPRFDRLTALASTTLDVPIALISLVDEEEAVKTFDLLKQLGELHDLDTPEETE